MQEDVHDLEEVVLFPNMDPPIADHGPRSIDEVAAGSDEVVIAALREWLALQLAQLEGQIRKQSGPSKPSGLTSELATYIQARESQAARKASRDAYMRALQKLDHFARV